MSSNNNREQNNQLLLCKTCGYPDTTCYLHILTERICILCNRLMTHAREAYRNALTNGPPRRQVPDYFLYNGRDPLPTATNYPGGHAMIYHGGHSINFSRGEATSRSGPGFWWLSQPEHGYRKMDNCTQNRTKRSHGTSSPSGGRADKTTTGCNQFLRYANLLFTFIIFVAGAGILGLGVYILGSDYGAKQVSELLGNDLYQIAAYVLITSGSVLVLISMCGCCGTLRESKVMLGCFVFAISVLVLALVAAAVMVFVFRQKMEGDIIHSMENVLIKQYGVDLEKSSENRIVTDAWNWLQGELQCCGVTGDANSTTSWAIYRHSEWYQGFQTGKPYVPQSCCKADGDINICTGIADLNGPPSVSPPLTAKYETNMHLNTMGCYDELVHYIQNHAIIIGVSSIGAVVILLIGLVFSLYLCRRIDTREEFYY